MKKAAFILMMSLFLASCNPSSFPAPSLGMTGETIIDWVDFVELENGTIKQAIQLSLPIHSLSERR